ncbi:Mitotic spindle organiZing protein (MOZART) homolog [Caenorhabditis elegans]|uniref:Mitotic spindle organiZing protein (MOZART) homolog n=1 Tax=Caenorhabditis elegans TaxID=6239 RepID=Q4W503_CAEEL|nr:Mitotic spindle organiZing protein (MOZART) homolog [Caenorhabditis elegans]CCD70132.1 Mitotic spindle organiZing protein (MOZART) homolog [Caenorhabditis elegans]|eukprot:NP_001021663.2 Mitotic spindle organiZing protein (MOZART) homolog [Caenorhabditis elegans]
MSDPKKHTQRIVEMGKFLNVFLTAEQVSSVERLLSLGVSPLNLVRLIQNLGTPSTQSSPSNRENALS